MSELARRLGLVPGAKVALVNLRPQTAAALPVDGVVLYERASEPLDVIVYCSDELANMTRRAPVFARFVRRGGRLWLGHPRPGSGVDTDLTGAAVERIALAAGLRRFDSVDIGDWRVVGFERP